MSRAAVAALAVALGAAEASAGEPTYTLDLALGARVRDDRGYASHARAFGYPNAAVGIAYGGVAGVRVAPGLRIRLSLSGARLDDPNRQGPELSVSNLELVAGVGYTPLRRELEIGLVPWSFALELCAGAGLYMLHEELDGHGSSSRGPGAMAGARAGIAIGHVSLAMAYTFHVATATVSDRLGGELGAGGHGIVMELGVGL